MLAASAASTSQLGVLHAAQGRAADAVPYTLASLAIQLEIVSPEAGFNIHWLGRQREMLGDTAFRAILADYLSPGDVESVVGLLDPAADADGASAGEGPGPARGRGPRGLRHCARRRRRLLRPPRARPRHRRGSACWSLIVRSEILRSRIPVRWTRVSRRMVM
ncbi:MULTISPECIES: hypothetical protein [unclassified Frankia]|uniref:hypothetical protein n=1 Tax=unclassified Frankia TaxID=2632575 RepID=UPI002AD2949A|nr:MULTISPECIES: hypothetical protein [unclassified Frankia]